MKYKTETLTKAICNKGFSGNLNIVPRSNFGVGGQERSPQSLTAYSLNRYGQFKNRTQDNSRNKPKKTLNRSRL